MKLPKVVLVCCASRAGENKVPQIDVRRYAGAAAYVRCERQRRGLARELFSVSLLMPLTNSVPAAFLV
jgi:hypothetical protein